MAILVHIQNFIGRPGTRATGFVGYGSPRFFSSLAISRINASSTRLDMVILGVSETTERALSQVSFEIVQHNDGFGSGFFRFFLAIDFIPSVQK